jgi:hypothetical protein
MQAFIKNPDKVTVFLSEALFKNSALFMALRLGHYKERAITCRHVVYRQNEKRTVTLSVYLSVICGTVAAQRRTTPH